MVYENGRKSISWITTSLTLIGLRGTFSVSLSSKNVEKNVFFQNLEPQTRRDTFNHLATWLG